ncbi:1792_t:CDS:2, partial [Paraglomus brasilianum]
DRIYEVLKVITSDTPPSSPRSTYVRMPAPLPKLVKITITGLQSNGNAAIDEIIRRTQLQTRDFSKHWEWIDPQRLEDITHFKDGGFGSVYVAVWKDGDGIIKIVQ